MYALLCLGFCPEKRGKGEKSRFFHFSICKMHDRCYITLSKRCWRDGRAVEGAALEMLFRRNLNASSNLALSAITNSFLRERKSSIPHSKTFARRNFTARICTRNPERRQGVYRRADMKLAAVGIGLFRQSGITVPHSFLSDTRRRSGLLKQCTEGDPQGVKIVFGRIRNTRGNPIRFQLVKWKEGSKYSFGMRNTAICSKSFHKLRTQRNNGLLAVFGIAFINDKSWIIRFKLYIAPQKAGYFLSAQTRINRSHYNALQTQIRKSLQEMLNLNAGQRFTLAAFNSVQIDFLNMLERIFYKILGSDEPACKLVQSSLIKVFAAESLS